MAISREKKVQILDTLKKGFSESTSVAFAKTFKLTVAEMSDVRKDLREADAKMMLAKKTLINLAYKEVHGADLPDEVLDGQLAVVFGKSEDPIAPLGAVNKHAKELNKNPEKVEKIVFLGAHFEGQLQDADTTKKLAGLPSREVLLAKMMGSMQSPVSGLARFFDGAKAKLEETGGATVADLTVPTEEVEASEKTEEAPAAPAAEEAKAEPVEEKAETPAEKADDTPAEEAPKADEAPAKEASAEEAKTEETPAGETPSEQESAPAEEAKSE